MGLFSSDDTQDIDPKYIFEKKSRRQCSLDEDSISEKINNHEHETVSEDWLLKKRAGCNSKPIRHISDEEQPKFVLWDRDDTANLFYKSKKSLIIFTDSSIYIIYPNGETDEVWNLSYDTISKISWKFGRVSHKIEIRVDDSIIPISISNAVTKSTIKKAVHYVQRSAKSRKSSNLDEKEHISYDQNNEIEEINDISPTDPLNYIDSNEKIVGRLTDGEKYVGVGINNKENTLAPADEHNTTYLVTNRRIIIFIPQQNRDKVIDLDYKSVEIECIKIFDGIIGENRYRLVLKTNNNNNLHLWIHPEYDNNDVEKSLIYMVEKIDRDIFCCLVTPKKYGKLIDRRAGKPKVKIVDRETGKMEMETKGWNYGPSIGPLHVLRQSSNSTIEKEGYEAEINELYFTDEEIFLNTSDPDSDSRQGSKQINRPISNILAVDRISNGLTIYLETGVYRFEFESKFHSQVHSDRIDILIEYIKEKIDDKNESERKKSESEDNIEMIKNLHELKKNGIITDKEFKQKKKKILDEI